MQPVQSTTESQFMAAPIFLPHQISQVEVSPLSTLMNARQFPTEMGIKQACNAAINQIKYAIMRVRTQMHSDPITKSINKKKITNPNGYLTK